MRIRHSAGAVAALLSAAMVVATGGARTAAVEPLDAQWLRSSAQTNVYEISVGNLAVAKGSGEACAIGRTLVQDHVRTLADTRRVANALGVRLPTRPTLAQRASLRQLRSAEGVGFQRLFVRLGLADHRAALKADRAQAMASSEGTIRVLSRQEISTQSKHLSALRYLSRSPSRNLGSGCA